MIFIHTQLFLALLLTFALFLLFLVLMIYTIRYLLTTPFNLTFNPPKAHAFVEIALKSAISDMVITIGVASTFIPTIVRNSAYLFAAGIYLSMFVDAISFILVPVLIGLMEQIIQYTEELHAQALACLNNSDNSLAMLREVHAYLTPYIRSYESLFDFIQSIVIYLERVGSDYLTRVETLEEQFRDAGNNLLEVYRGIEREISISIDESPISIQE